MKLSGWSRHVVRTPGPRHAICPKLACSQLGRRADERFAGRDRPCRRAGRQLYLCPLTAKTRVSRILGKQYVRDQAQLVVVARESGLVTPGAS